jgi:hypothetical protein
MSARLLRLAFSAMSASLVLTPASAAQYSEQDLGKLFNTPAQRQQLDTHRKGIRAGTVHEQTAPSDVRLQGLVKRSDGVTTVWVNGQSTLKSNAVAGMQVNTNTQHDSNRISITINDKTIKLKPGEVWSEESNHISNGY